jgi:hypothetical protein
MKAFVVVALLVASVASQRMDILQQLNKEKSLFKADRPLTVEDLLLKEKLGGHFLTTKTNMMEQEYPTTWGRHQVTLLSLEELVGTELFREYYNIPLFRQFWEQYPVVFHKYVQSVLFQQFWTIPQFQQYFRNPVFFYKYIVPQVQVIAQSVSRDQYQNVDLFNTNKYESIVDRMTNKFSYPYGIQHQYNKEWTVPMTQQGYGIEGLQYPTMNSGVNYKFLLDKIYKHLNMNYGKVEGIETLTDVKVLPTGQIKEQVFGKIVDPITGEEKVTRGDLKIVDEKIVPVQTLDFPVEKRMNRIVESEMKDALLKRIYLNKIFGKKFMTPEYETIFGKKVMTPEFESVYGKKFLTPEYETVFGKKFTPEYESVFDKKFLTPEYETIYGKHIMTPELESVFGKKVMTPEIYERMMMNKGIYNTYEPEMSQWGSVLPTEDRYMNTNKWMSPIVARMYGLNKVNKINNFLPYGQQYNKMDLINKFNTEKLIEEIQKEKLVNQFETEKMINNQIPFLTKEHAKLFNTLNLEKSMEIPQMETEKYQHIPLTFTKATVGSGINEFQKEIKY